MLQLRCRRIAEGLQNEVKEPVVESTRGKSAIIDIVGRAGLDRCGALAAAVVCPAMSIDSANSESRIRSHVGRLSRSANMTGELS